ncbi:MAG: bifunctional diguanylate cyclase/phosphodiesterase [Aquabacterium sp.]|uniref:putative bifunctional diguanylate cyclase/phosphodiesterase n=1 Tax=Aquabacterium sp. TaxID=1872578 RepID=UPI0025C341E5|nr:bifunctional diguanylate cyclase/phosphodiesterase [Aquabacterium sp.]MBI3380389.1 bifunctional diguanylate cyclase/phosphodiesterase [Aquabacterium sp.]
MASVPNTTQASVKGEVQAGGAWLTPARVVLAAVLLLCALQLFFRVSDARAHGEVEGAAALAMIEQQPAASITPTGQVPAALQASLATVFTPRNGVLSLALCQGAQCSSVFARPGALPCESGLSWPALCVAVPSHVNIGDTLKVGYDLQPYLWSALLDLGVTIVLGAGVLLVWRGKQAAPQAVAGKAGSPAAAPAAGSDRDPLTGLLNRVAFEAAVKRHNETSTPSATGETDGCLMYFDLDRFKAINDTHGHIAGDLVLKAVAGRLRYTLGNGAVIGRLGGDEFAALLIDVSTQTTIQQMGRVLIEQVSKPIQMGGLTDSVGLSIGAFMLKRGELAVGDILHRADLAMYEAKRGGRGRMMFFEEAMDAASRSRAQVQIDLSKAIQDREMFMVYQPQVDAFDSIRGVESLVRWRHPTRGLVSPDEFISIAEQTGLIVPLGKMIIELVCADLVALRAQRLALPYVSVNLSLRQLADPAFVDEVQEALKRHGLNPTDLEFEITESTAMVGQAAKETATLKRLAEMGFRLAIDDFGTGYSSLGRLLDLKVDKLKIDRVFVAAITKPNFDPALLELMISLAKRMGIKSVAEGVENVDQVVWLRQAGCQMMQGDLYSRPMNHSQLISWLRLQEGDNDFDEGVWSPTMTMEESEV